MSALPVSVLMPVHDAAPFVAEAVADVLAQEGVELELIAVHQGGDDASLAALRAFADPRLRVLRRERPDTGAALEAGRRAARHPWLARMDADDRCPRDRLRRQLAAAVALEADVVACQVEAIAAPGEPDRARYLAWHNALLQPAEMAAERFVEAPYLQGAALLRAAAVEAVGGWRAGVVQEDYDLILRMFAAGARHHKLAAPLYRWRIHPGQHSRGVDPAAIRALKVEHLRPLLAPDAYVAGVGTSAADWARRLGLPCVRFSGREARGLPAGQPICVFGSPTARARAWTALAARGLAPTFVA